jgi:hypothetical protein
VEDGEEGDGVWCLEGRGVLVGVTLRMERVRVGGGKRTSFRYAVMNWERMLDVAESRQADIVAWTMGEAGAMIGDRSLELYKSGSRI